MADKAEEKIKEIFADLPLANGMPSDTPSQPANVIDRWRERYHVSGVEGLAASSVFLRAVRFQKINLTNVAFDGCDLRESKFDGSTLLRVSFGQHDKDICRLDHAVFVDATLTGVIFTGNLRNVDFRGASLKGCEFDRTNLRGATFDGASLNGVEFIAVEVDSKTKFNDLQNVERVKIDRFTLHCLQNFGGLSEGNRMRMTIVDDAALLRSQFGGMWGMLHLAAVLIFLFPYTWFVVRQWTMVRAFGDADPDKSMTLLSAIFGFIVTGGGNWKGPWTIAWMSLLCFVLFTCFNLGRLALLWKTKKLETTEELTGLPVEFSLDDDEHWWGVLYHVCNAGFWVLLAATAYNTYHFLMMRVPT